MPIVTPEQASQIGLVVAPVIFLLVVFFTRAGLRRVLSGLAGAVVFALANFGWDQVAESAGWWQYPGYNASGQLPLEFYAFAGVVCSAFGLIGWRITRRFGAKGFFIFLALWSLWGFTHDVAGSALFAASNLMVLGPGITPLIADFLLYATCMGLVFFTIRLVGGPFGSDSLQKWRT